MFEPAAPGVVSVLLDYKLHCGLQTEATGISKAHTNHLIGM